MIIARQLAKKKRILTFSWQEQDCFCHSNIKFISFRQHVISPIYHDNSTDTIPLKFVTQPTDVTTAENTNATISCVAIGSSPVTYTWTHNGTMLTVGSNTGRYRLMGADGNLTVINVTWNDAGVYRCIAKSSMGSALSLKAVIRIACKYYPSLSRGFQLIYRKINLTSGLSHKIVSSKSVAKCKTLHFEYS